MPLSAWLALGVLGLLVPFCNDPAPAPRPPTALPWTAPASGWQFQYSPGMAGGPTSSGLEWYFDFPHGTDPHNNNPVVGYVTLPTGVSLKVGSMLVANYTVTAQPGTVWQYFDSGCNTPAHATLYLQQAGDDLSAQGDFNFYRWFASNAGIANPFPTDGAKSFNLAVPIDVTNFGDVMGTPATNARLQVALSNLQRIGIVFGGGCAAGHGLRVSAGGARFTMEHYQVR